MSIIRISVNMTRNDNIHVEQWVVLNYLEYKMDNS